MTLLTISYLLIEEKSEKLKVDSKKIANIESTNVIKKQEMSIKCFFLDSIYGVF